MSGPGRLHDLFVTHEAMSPGDYKTRGAGLTIRYGYHISPFGMALIMVTDRGLAGLAFNDAGGERAPSPTCRAAGRMPPMSRTCSATAPYAARIFDPTLWRADQPLRVVMIGTDFQLRVWEALLRIPMGKACTYSSIAARDRRADGKPGGGCRGRRQSDVLRRAVPPGARQIRRADRLPLGPDAQARHPRLGSGPGRKGLIRQKLLGARKMRPTYTSAFYGQNGRTGRTQPAIAEPYERAVNH